MDPPHFVPAAPNRGVRVRTDKRDRIFERDSWLCQYCGVDLRTLPPIDRTLDHVVPKSRGGTTTLENLVAACRRCNGSRSNDMPTDIDITDRNYDPRRHVAQLLRQLVTSARRRDHLLSHMRRVVSINRQLQERCHALEAELAELKQPPPTDRVADLRRRLAERTATCAD